MSYYHRLVCGLYDIGKMIPADDNPYNHIDDREKDWYISLNLYNQEQKIKSEKIINKNNKPRPRGVAGFKDLMSRCVAFDFDNKNNIMEAHRNTNLLIGRLLEKEIEEKAINISFSGSKGFSVLLYLEKILPHPEVVSMATSLARGLDNDRTIYDANQIFRIDNTRHQRSGLYKTPLTLSEFRAFGEETNRLAQRRRPDRKLRIYIPPIKPAPICDLKGKPEYLTDTQYVMEQGHIPEGEGNMNAAMLILCSQYKSAGLDEEAALSRLETTHESRAELYNVEPWDSNRIESTIVNYVYSDNFGSKQYGPNHPLLKRVSKEFDIVDNGGLLSIGSIRGEHKALMQAVKDCRVKTGLEPIDNLAVMYPGIVVGLLGATGVGKTTLALQIVESVLYGGGGVLYEALDLNPAMIYEKLIRKFDGNIAQLESVYANCLFQGRQGITTNEIRDHIGKAKDILPDLSLVVVDYLGVVKGPYPDKELVNIEAILKELSIIAKESNCVVLLLLQTQKMNNSKYTALPTVSCIKGASIIEELCRVVFSVWKQTERVSTIAIIKQNLGPCAEYSFGFDGYRGTFFDQQNENIPKVFNADFRQEEYEGGNENEN